MSEAKIELTQAKLDEIVAKAEAKGKSEAEKNAIAGIPAHVLADRRDEARDGANETMEFLKAFSLPQGKREEFLLKRYDANPSLYIRKTNYPYESGDNGSGGYITPQYWYDRVIKLTEKYGFWRRDALKIPMAGLTLNIPVGDSKLVTVNYPGEVTAPTAQDARSTFTTVQLTAALAIAVLPVSRTLLADTNVAVIDFLSDQVAKAFGKSEDAQAFAGTGSPFTGLIGNSGVNTVYMGGSLGSGSNTTTKISWTDINAVINSVTPTAQEGAQFYMSQAAYQYLRNEVDSNKRPIWSISTPMNQAGEQGVNGRGMLMGFPANVIPTGVFGTSTSPNTAQLVFGNLGQWAVFGSRQDMTIEQADQYAAGYDLMGTNSIALVTKERYAPGVLQASAFGVLKTSLS